VKSIPERQENGNLDEIWEQVRGLVAFVEQSAQEGIAADEVENPLGQSVKVWGVGHRFGRPKCRCEFIRYASVEWPKQ